MALLPALLLALAGCDVLLDADVSEHPCFGNRTDALWHDDAEHAWVGCGSTTEGYGLYATDDGGRTWQAPTTYPAGFFEFFRVSSISRSADGLLYVAGTDHGDTDARAVSLTDSGTVDVVYASQGQTWNSFHVGTFRRASDGRAAAESHTGADLTWRASDGDDWAGASWSSDGQSHQLLDMVLHGDDFYGCGSTIIEPPLVFLPALGEPASFSLDPVQVADYSGELWGLGASGDGLVAGGVDQDRDVGMVHTAALDAYDPGDWSTFDLSTLLGDEPTWVRGTCRDHGLVVAVGEYSRRSEGIVLVSDDGGASFTDHTPDGAPSLHRCVVLDGSTAAIAGAEGFYAKLDL